MANDHPDAPKQFGIRLHPDVVEMVSKIQNYRRKNNYPSTLSSIVEDAIEQMFDFMVEDGTIEPEE